jgi:hypothetical protein
MGMGLSIGTETLFGRGDGHTTRTTLLRSFFVQLVGPTSGEINGLVSQGLGLLRASVVAISAAHTREGQAKWGWERQKHVTLRASNEMYY